MIEIKKVNERFNSDSHFRDQRAAGLRQTVHRNEPHRRQRQLQTADQLSPQSLHRRGIRKTARRSGSGAQCRRDRVSGVKTY